MMGCEILKATLSDWARTKHVIYLTAKRCPEEILIGGVRLSGGGLFSKRVMGYDGNNADRIRR